MLSVASAIAYAVYAITLRKKIPDENALHMPMFFAFVGLFNFLLLWPFLFVLHYTRVERFEWPTLPELGSLALNGLIGSVVSDLLWLWAVLLTSALITTIGLSLSVPLAVLSDVILHGARFQIMYIVGLLCVFCGFLMVNLDKQIMRVLRSILARVFSDRYRSAMVAPPVTAVNSISAVPVS
jgi:solute carrier family 35 protein F5